MKKTLLGMIAVLGMTAQAFADDANMFNVTTAGKTFNITTTVPNHFYPAAGIKINTAGYEITSGCTPAASGYCLFGVSDTQIANISFSGGSGNLNYTLCLDGNGPLSCQKLTQTVSNKFLYVTNLNISGSNAVEVCSINPDGTLSNCVPAGNTINNFDGPASISINADNTFAYVINYPGESISVCPINGDGTFADCIQEKSFYFSYGGSQISPDGQTLFVTNYCTQSVDACPIKPDGTLADCVDTGANGTESPYGMILNKAGTIAYVAELFDSNSTAVCTVSGTSFSCDPSGSADAGPLGLAFSEDETQVYVTNTNYGQYSVQVCDVGSGGSLSCLDAGYSDSTEPWGITVDGPNNRAYVSNYQENAIELCTIVPDTGALTNCIDSGVGGNFYGPALMSLSN